MQIPSEDGGTNVVGGVYKEIQAPDRIVFSWQWEPRGDVTDDEMEITIEFRELDSGMTEMSLRQILVPDQEIAERHSWGWNETFEKLKTYLEEAKNVATH